MLSWTLYLIEYHFFVRLQTCAVVQKCAARFMANLFAKKSLNLRFLMTILSLAETSILKKANFTGVESDGSLPKIFPKELFQ